MSVSLDPILSINDRIKEYHNPPASTAAAKQQVQVPIQTLPRISSPLRNDPVVLKPAPPSTNSEKLVGYAKSYIETPVPAKNIGPRVQQVIDLTLEKFGAKDQQNAYQAGTLMYRVYQGAMWILQSPVGGLFRQTFRRRLIKVILGTPYSQLTNIINAIDSIASLAVASLKEDQFGTANKDIADIIRTFTKTFQNIEAFAQGLPAHWTDIEFNATDRRVEEVELVKEHLKVGLGHVLYMFGPYASEMGLKKSELVTAKQVAGSDAP
jgi:nucleoporin NDC1